MKSHTTKRFRTALAALPTQVRDQAREVYRRFIVDPRHPGLQLKRVHPIQPVYSVRINLDFRAVGLLEGDTILWLWIGRHAEYERLLKQL